MCQSRRAVFNQLQIAENDMYPVALFKDRNDILLKMNSQLGVFGTVDHLVKRLSMEVGIFGKGLNCLKSYLSQQMSSREYLHTVAPI